MSAPIRRLVLDVLKPHEPCLVTIADAVADCTGVDGVNAVLVETDREVTTIKLTIAGSAIDKEAVETALTDLGGTVHSIDEVVCGEQVVEQSRTPQDG